jgi:hypothetical protein
MKNVGYVVGGLLSSRRAPLLEDDDGVPFLIQSLAYQWTVMMIHVRLFNEQRLTFTLETALDDAFAGARTLRQTELTELQHMRCLENLEPIILERWKDITNHAGSHAPRGI